MDSSAITSHWGLTKKIAFRFVFIFFVLFIAIQNNGAFPFWYIIIKYPTELLHTIIPWIGKHILHLPYDITVFTNGSGDRTYDYVILITILIISLLGTVLWSVLDKNRENYDKLYYWLTVVVRFYVGLMLIHYGLGKIIKVQFPDPAMHRLIQNYGDSSPMGLAWTFLGFSKGYNIFMGIAEIAAVFLLFRRTMTFGAIITLMTTANIMAINYFYDVPVKMVSTALVVMTLFLLLNDARHLFKFFFTGNAVSLPIIKAPEIRKKWIKTTKLGIKTVVIGYYLISGIVIYSNNQKKVPIPKLYGLYDVDTFIINNDTLPPLKTDLKRWDQFIIDKGSAARIIYMNKRQIPFRSQIIDTGDPGTIELTSGDDSPMEYSFKYTIPDSNRLHLSGKLISGDSVKIYMTRRDFELINRGFNWINERPYNR